MCAREMQGVMASLCGRLHHPNDGRRCVCPRVPVRTSTQASHARRGAAMISHALLVPTTPRITQPAGPARTSATCRLCTFPFSSIMIISPGRTSRTRSKPMGPNAQSSLATHHSSPRRPGRLPSTSGLQGGGGGGGKWAGRRAGRQAGYCRQAACRHLLGRSSRAGCLGVPATPCPPRHSYSPMRRGRGRQGQ